MYCSSTTALVCMLGTLTALWGWSWIIHFFSPSPSFILFFLHFAGRMCACLSLCVNLVTVSLPLSLYFIILRQLRSSALTAWCEPNDSSLEQSLKQERAGNNHLLPLCSVVYCLPFAVLFSYSLTSPIGTFISSLCLSLAVSPQIPMLLGSTALTMPWSEEWWL